MHFKMKFRVSMQNALLIAFAQHAPGTNSRRVGWMDTCLLGSAVNGFDVALSEGIYLDLVITWRTVLK